MISRQDFKQFYLSLILCLHGKINSWSKRSGVMLIIELFVKAENIFDPPAATACNNQFIFTKCFSELSYNYRACRYFMLNLQFSRDNSSQSGPTHYRQLSSKYLLASHNQNQFWIPFIRWSTIKINLPIKVQFHLSIDW